MKHTLRTAVALALLGGGLALASAAGASSGLSASQRAEIAAKKATLDTASLSALGHSNNRLTRTSATISGEAFVGFEAPDFNPGELDGQADWWTQYEGEWEISASNPAEGTQHLRAVSGGWGSSAASSPVFPDLGTGDFSIATVQFAITQAGSGSAQYFAPVNEETGTVNTRVRFNVDGTIDTLQLVGGAGAWAATTGTYTQGEYHELRVVTNNTDGTLELCLNGSSIFSGDNIVAALGLTPLHIDVIQPISGMDSGSEGSTFDLDNLRVRDSAAGGCIDGPTHTVTPSVGAGDGTITPDTPRVVPEGQSTSFTLVPDIGFIIDTVGGTCGGSLDGNVYTTDPVSADCTVIANFVAGTAPEWTVTPSVGTGNGSISPDTPQSVVEYQTATFTLTPDAGYMVDDVGGTCGGVLSGDTFVTDSVTEDCTVIANFVEAPFPLPYCDVTFSSGVEPISRVLFTGIDNTSSAAVGGSPALEDFLAVTGGEVMQGFSYPAAVEGNTGGNFTNKVTVYIDWNQDGVFSETTEAYQLTDLVGSTGTDNQQAIGDIEVPVDATPGETRMRVIKKFNTVAPPCNTSGFGQAEDYTITVLPIASYTVTPSVGAGTGTISPDVAQTVDHGDSATFTLTPAADFVVDNVGGTCGGTLTGNTFVTDPVAADCSVIVNFKSAGLVVTKAFDPDTIADFEQTTAIVTLTNQLASDATLIAPFIDVLPTGLTATSVTTNCGLILTGGEATISATQFGLPGGIVLPAESSCEIRATIVPDVAGTYVNEIPVGALKTHLGENTEAAEATLVVYGQPEIDVSEESLSATLVTNSTETQTLDISNVGTGDLVWNITEAGPLNANPPSFRNVTRIGSSAGAALTSGASLGLRGTGAPVILAPTDISQMADNSPGDQGVSCGQQSVSTADNSWWRRFYFNEHPEVGSSTNVTAVTISTGSIDIPGGLPTTINLYTIPHSTPVDTIPTAALTLIGTTTTTVSGALASVTIPVTGTISDTVANDLVVEWHTPGVDSGGQFFPGANATPQTHPTFISSATCGITEPTTNTAIGFPDFHLTMVVTVDSDGAGGTRCANPSDVPWLSVSPDNGSTGAGDSDTVNVTFDANGVPPGNYEAELCINSNDEENPVVSVPVQMEVTPSGVTFDVTPSVSGANGTISPNTVQTVDENGLVDFTLTPDFGFGVGTVGGTCPGTLSGNTYTAGPVTADCTVEASFTALPFPAPYCNVTFPTGVEPISRVVFSGIDNASDPAVGGSPALEDFLAVAGGDVSLGGVYSIAVEGNTDGAYTSRIRAYIDWNRDGVFDASEAYVLSDLIGSTGTDGKQATGEIRVPEDALLGETRMRVIKRFSSVPEPCNSAGFGQAEDYTIIVNDDPLPQPAIDLDKFALNITAMSGSSGTDTLQVGNIGEAGSRLEYQIRRALAGPASNTGISSEERRLARQNDLTKPGAALATHGAHASLLDSADTVASIRNVVFANDPLCQVGTPGLVVNDGNGAPDNGYGWNASAGSDAKYVDKFTPSAYPATFTTVCISMLTNAGLTSAPVKVVVFDDDGPGGAPGTELGRVNATANKITAALEQNFQAIDISEMGLEITDGSVYIGLEWDATAVSGLYIAADESSSANAGGYSYSSGEWTPIIEGFDEYKSMYVRAIEEQAGPPGIGCENPSNVSWLSVTPASGTIMDGDSQTVTVTGNATGMAPGTYEALICVHSNDPEYPRIDLMVTMEVTAQPPAIFEDGFEGEDPMCWPEQLFQDTSFEATVEGDNPYWDAYDMLFGSPLCDASCASGVTAHTGNWFAWLGGADEPAEAHVAQDVVLGSGQTRHINFWLRNQLQGDATASLEIRVDGNVIHSVDPGAGDPTMFTLMTVEVPASYLDDDEHTVGFYWTSQAPGGEISGAMIDDVTLDCQAAPAGARPAGTVFGGALKRIR